MSKSDDERGFDGLTVREAIARRVLIGLNDLVEMHKDGGLDFDSTRIAIRVLVESTMPFVDSETKTIINHIVRKWDDEAEERRIAQRDLVRAEDPKFGAWS
jgi:hypothetical protein